MGRKDVTVSDLLSGFHDLNLGVKVTTSSRTRSGKVFKEFIKDSKVAKEFVQSSPETSPKTKNDGKKKTAKKSQNHSGNKEPGKKSRSGNRSRNKSANKTGNKSSVLELEETVLDILNDLPDVQAEMTKITNKHQATNSERNPFLNISKEAEVFEPAAEDLEGPPAFTSSPVFRAPRVVLRRVEEGTWSTSNARPPKIASIWDHQQPDLVEELKGGETNSVHSCICFKRCNKDCDCRTGNLMCGPACSCFGSCKNGPMDNKPLLEVRTSLIPGAGLGCFVTAAVKAGQLLQEYKGEIVGRSVSDKRASVAQHSYIVQLNDQLDIDGGKGGSEVCRANHSRYPNAEFCHRFLRVPGGVRPAVFVWARKALKAGQELYLNYGPQYPTQQFKKK